jgi:hypothetical protein
MQTLNVALVPHNVFLQCLVCRFSLRSAHSQEGLGSTVDPTLPRQSGPYEQPLALNFGNGNGQPLLIKLHSEQDRKVGFLTNFLVTKYCGSGLSRILQISPLKYINGVRRDPGGKRTRGTNKE